MVLLHCNVRVSLRTQIVSAAIYSLTALAVMFAPWPENGWPIWTILLLLVLMEFFRSQRRIALTQGELTLLSRQHLFWQDREWQIIRSPFILKNSIFLLLKSPISKKYHRLWLMSDSMNKNEWRCLRYALLHHTPE